MVSSSATCKELFHNMTALLGKTSKPSLPSVYDLQQLPGIFKDLFKNKILSIQSSFSLTARKIDDCQSAFSGAPFLFYTPVSQEIVKKIVLQTVPKTCLPDPIPTQLLYENLKVFLPTITNILNKSLASGTVPANFKAAATRPLLKELSLNPNEVKNYRPISNLPFLSKLLKKLVCQQLAGTAWRLYSSHTQQYSHCSR